MILSKHKIFILHYILALLVAIILKHLMGKTGCETLTNAIEISPCFIFIIVLVAPVVETIVGQLVPFKILQFFNIRNYYLIFFILSFYFSFLHQKFLDNVTLFILFTISCSILVSYFLYVQKHKGTKNAFVKSILFHSIYNTTILIFQFF